MSNNTEIRVAVWNASHALDPMNEEAHYDAAMATISGLNEFGGPFDALCLPETTSSNADQAHLDRLYNDMADRGYLYGVMGQGVRPDDSLVSLWSRRPIDGNQLVLIERGDRTLPQFQLDGVDIVGVHYPSDSEEVRVKVSEDIVATGVLSRAVLCDANSVWYEGGGKSVSTRILHATAVNGLAKATQRALGVVDHDGFHQGTMLQRYGGRLVRASYSSLGSAMATLRDAGFSTANRANRPTATYGPFHLALDQIVVSSDLSVSNFRVGSRPRARRGLGRVFDHSPLMADIARPE